MCSRKWLIVALVACGLASACSQYNTNLSIQTSSSTLTFVSPRTATVGSQGFTITATGTGFVPGAFILWNGTGLTTTYVSSAQLTAPVPASDLMSAGTVQIAIDIPGSAVSGTANPNNGNVTTTTEVSNIVLFTVNATPPPVPAIASMSPVSMPFCSNTSGFTLTVNAASGTTFTSDAVVNWNGSARATTSVSPTQLTAAIQPMDTAIAGPSATVTVVNSSGASNALSFTLTSPTANLVAPQAITSLMPATGFVGSPATMVTVNGSSFLPCSVVQWGTGNNVPTQYVSATQLVATVPASDFLAAGTVQLDVLTPPPGGGTSPTPNPPSRATFTIAGAPTPTITSLSASTTNMASTPACSPASFTLTVMGSKFVNGSVVNWNGSPRPTTFLTPASLTAIISYLDIVVPTATVPITVSNFAATSNPQNFTVAPPASLPAPSVTSITPPKTTAGSGLTSVIVVGSNFLPCSTVQLNGSTRASSYVGATQLSVSLLPADVSSVGPVSVTVLNPSPGGGSSSAQFSVVAPTITSLSASTTNMASTPFCSTQGFTLTVNGTDFIDGLSVNWNGPPRGPVTFVSATQLTVPIGFADIASQGTVDVTVSNSAATSKSVKFSITAPTTNLSLPAITSLNPSSAAAGGAAFPLDMTGTNLLPCSVVHWNTTPLTTIFRGPTGVTGTVPNSLISSAGTAQITVVTPPPGGGTSNVLPFTVFTPAAAALRSAAATLSSASDGGTPTAEVHLSLPLESAAKRYAVFVLASTDGATEIPGTTQNIFIRDTCTGAPAGCVPSVALASIGFNSNPADGDSISPSISEDGRYVAFLSAARNLVDSDTNGVMDVFVRDTCAGAPSGCTPSTQRASVATDGAQANGTSTSATISATGRYVTFESTATNLGPLSSSAGGVFLRDTCAGAGSGCTPSTQELTQH